MLWIVGDIHGCAREFDDLLRAIRFDPGRDVLWSAGDLVNTGPHTIETLRLWRDVGGRAVLGNHDIYAVLSRAGLRPRHEDRLDGLYAAPDGDALATLLSRQPVIVPIERPKGQPETWLVHAGLHPDWEHPRDAAPLLGGSPDNLARLQREEVTFATRVRCCAPDGTRDRHVGRPEDAPDGFRAWDDYYRGDALVVHGHWAMRGHYRDARTIGLDSGCVYGHRLTAWCAEEDRIEQVPARDPAGYK